jgi:hypothetical protein
LSVAVDVMKRGRQHTSRGTCYDDEQHSASSSSPTIPDGVL